MDTSAQRRAQVARRLLEQSTKTQHLPCMAGLDGFVDEIIRVIDKKKADGSWSSIATIADFASRIAQAAGLSTNIELRVQTVKLGGNGPIMANALCRFGFPLTYIGSLGRHEIHPVFHDFVARTTACYSIAEAAFTHALEFDDGKIMLGKSQSLDELTFEDIRAVVGDDTLQRLWQESRFIALTNWTMIPHMTDIWLSFLQHYAPAVADRPWLFFDLADPEKRDRQDIRRALEVLSRFQSTCRVILGCNEKESLELAEILAIDERERTQSGTAARAAALRTRLGIEVVVIHPVKFAAAADCHHSVAVDGPFVAAPKISTGAGDHFNAGFCMALVLGMGLEEALYCGTGTSGYYVRTAESPSLENLAAFLPDWSLPD